MYKDEKKSSSLAETIAPFDYLIVDTCSLMDPNFPDWMDILAGAKSYLNPKQPILVFYKCVEELKKQIKDDLHSEDSSAEDDEREAGMLYAEFAMDFATLAMQQALISVLNALDKEKKAETAATEDGRREQEADPPGLKEKEAVYMEGENEECRK